VERCTIHHAGLTARDTGYLGDGIDFQSDSGFIQDNLIYECGSHGIYVRVGGANNLQNVTVQRNEVYNCYHSGIDLMNLGTGTFGGHVVRRNHVYCTTDYDDPTIGMAGIYTSAITGPAVCTDVEISCNKVHDVYGVGIHLGKNTTNTRIYNNSVYNMLSSTTIDYCYYIASNAVTGITVKNNIGMDAADAVFYVATAVSITACDNNCWYQSGGGAAVYAWVNVSPNSYHYDDFATWITNSGFDTNSLWEDPLMTDPANGDFTLQATSPCINAGVDVGLTEDYEGNPIVGLPDIGAYEYPGGAITAVTIFFGCDF